MKNLIKVYSVFLALVVLVLTTQAKAAGSCGDSIGDSRREQIARYITEIEETEGRKFLDLQEVIELYGVKENRRVEFVKRVERELAQGIMWKENPRISQTGDTLNVAAFNLYTKEQLRLTYQFILERE